MQNASLWRETKYVRDGRGSWQSSRTQIPISSRLVNDLAAGAYARAIDRYASGRLADLGCGSVPLYGMYRSKVSDVVCVDWPSSPHHAQHVDQFADLNCPLEIEPASFDTVLATDVLEHLFAPQVFIDSASRILRPGGRLILGVPFLYWVHEAPHDYHRYTRFALERMALQAGLANISITPYAGSPEVIADLVTKSVGRRFGLPTAAYWLSRALLELPLTKRLSASNRETLPMGYVLVAQKPIECGD